MKSASGKILVVILVIVIIIAAALLAVKFVKDGKIMQANTGEENVNEEPEVVEIKEIETFKGNERPIAVSIDNHIDAMPQANLTKAYTVYEMIAESGITRFIACFKGQDLDKIGPIRSARHYFLDYVLENDAIFVHHGHSPQAISDISKLGVNNLSGMEYDGVKNGFWRVKDKYAPHNSVTSTANIAIMAQSKKYRMTSDQDSVLNYVVDEVELESDIIADTVTIPFSSSNVVKYEYNNETQRYTRYSRGIKQVDWDTKEDVTTKNIIITFVKYSSLNDDKGRQTIDNLKTLDGYYITNGKAIKITCEKTTRAGQTVYKDLDGKEIEVNDGNTFIHLCPINAKVTIEPGEPEPETVTNTVE